MAQRTINIGLGELTGDGESLRSAFNKINLNFAELFQSVADSVTPPLDGGGSATVYDIGSTIYDGGNASTVFTSLDIVIDGSGA
jgi:hypothetical protein